MLYNPPRQHGRAENSSSPLLSFSGSPNTSSQFYDLPRRTGNSNIRSSGFPSDTVPLKTSNDWHVPFRYAFPTCKLCYTSYQIQPRIQRNKSKLCRHHAQTQVKIRN